EYPPAPPAAAPRAAAPTAAPTVPAAAAPRRTARRSARRATPATLPGVAGRPTLASACAIRLDCLVDDTLSLMSRQHVPAIAASANREALSVRVMRISCGEPLPRFSKKHTDPVQLKPNSRAWYKPISMSDESSRSCRRARRHSRACAERWRSPSIVWHVPARRISLLSLCQKIYPTIWPDRNEWNIFEGEQ